MPLIDCRIPAREEPVLGAFRTGVLISTRDALLYSPEILHRRYRALAPWHGVRLIASVSTNNMTAYGHWRKGELVRCISVNAVAGTHRDVGSREDFERDLTIGPESWLDPANAALASALALEGELAPPLAHPVSWESVLLHRFSRDRLP